MRDLHENPRGLGFLPLEMDANAAGSIRLQIRNDSKAGGGSELKAYRVGVELPEARVSGIHWGRSL